MALSQVLQAEQAVKVLNNQAEAEAASIAAHNDAYNKQWRGSNIAARGLLLHLRH